MAEREVITLNEDTPRLEAAQSGDTYLVPRAMRVADDLTLPNTSGKGMKVGDESAADFGWRDITGQIQTRGNASVDPTWAQIGAGPFWAYKFAIGDEIWIVYHIPHDYAPGSDIYLHVHWIPDGTDANTVKWKYDYTIAKGFDQSAFNTTGTTVYSELAGPGTAYQHMVSETVAISSSELEVDGLIIVNIERVTNGGTDNTDDIFMLTTDVHYQSSNLATKNKAPNFYT